MDTHPLHAGTRAGSLDEDVESAVAAIGDG